MLNRIITYPGPIKYTKEDYANYVKWIIHQPSRDTGNVKRVELTLVWNNKETHLE